LPLIISGTGYFRRCQEISAFIAWHQQEIQERHLQKNEAGTDEPEPGISCYRPFIPVFQKSCPPMKHQLFSADCDEW
jgi:hypothetical protein